MGQVNDLSPFMLRVNVKVWRKAFGCVLAFGINADDTFKVFRLVTVRMYSA